MVRIIIINNYVRLSAPYSEPDSAGVYIVTEKLNIKDSIQLVLFLMDRRKIVRLIDTL